MLIGHRLKEFSSMHYTLAVPYLEILHFLPPRIQFCLRLILSLLLLLMLLLFSVSL